MSDFFGGIFDSFQGYSDTASSFFSRFTDTTTAPRDISASEESTLIGNGWQSAASSSGSSSSSGSLLGGLGGLLGKAAGSASSVYSKQTASPPSMDALNQGTVNSNGAIVPPRKTSGSASVDPDTFANEWISRLSRFAKLEQIASKGMKG